MTASRRPEPTATPADADRWTAFGPAPEPVPRPARRAARAVGRFLVHEWTLAALAALALAVLMTWPTLRYPRYTLPQDYWDPSLQAWQMAWSGHILLHRPGAPVAVQHVLPGAVELRLLRHAARLRPGRA